MRSISYAGPMPVFLNCFTDCFIHLMPSSTACATTLWTDKEGNSSSPILELDMYSAGILQECLLHRLIESGTLVSIIVKAWAVLWCKCRLFKVSALWVELFSLRAFSEDTIPKAGQYVLVIIIILKKEGKKKPNLPVPRKCRTAELHQYRPQNKALPQVCT